MSKKPRLGREFEELIARIEDTLAPSGAVVKSPDYIRDLITKRRREVDASIRIPDGDETRLITVECRDHRKGRQDDRWIEQLITKREKIGAWKTIAVSSSGFSDSAIATASHYGIELRQMSQVTDAEIAQRWASVSAFEMAVIVVEYGVAEITIFDADKKAILDKELPPELLESLFSDPVNTGFLRKKGIDELSSAAHLNEFVETPQELEEDGAPISLTLSLEFHDNAWSVGTTSGERTVSRVLIKYDFYRRRLPAPIQSVKQYSSPEKPILELVKAEARRNDHHSYSVEAQVRLNRPLPAPATSKRSRKKK